MDRRYGARWRNLPGCQGAGAIAEAAGGSTGARLVEQAVMSRRHEPGGTEGSMPWNGGRAAELALPSSGCPKESQPERTKAAGEAKRSKPPYRGGRKEKASRHLTPGR